MKSSILVMAFILGSTAYAGGDVGSMSVNQTVRVKLDSSSLVETVNQATGGGILVRGARVEGVISALNPDGTADVILSESGSNKVQLSNVDIRRDLIASLATFRDYSVGDRVALSNDSRSLVSITAIFADGTADVADCNFADLPFGMKGMSATGLKIGKDFKALLKSYGAFKVGDKANVIDDRGVRIPVTIQTIFSDGTATITYDGLAASASGMKLGKEVVAE